VSALALALLEVVVISAPLFVVARAARVYPRKRLVLAFLIPAAISLGLLVAVMSPPLAPLADVVLALIVLIDAVLVLILAADLTTLPSAKTFAVEREAGRIVSLRKSHPVAIAVDNRAARGFDVSVRDGLPERLGAEPAQFDLRLAPRSRTALRYDLRAERRGLFALEAVHVRVESRLGLWQRTLVYPAKTVLHVYPDMKQLGQYAVLARTNRLSLLGVRRTRRIGQDHDFERLRDYTIDDNYKHIDWRSTARRRKLTVKDYQATQSQRILFLVDCGRMMTNEAAGLSLLDHALNALLMLSYVALRQGDSVGLIAFSDEIHSFVPVRGGMNQMNRLLHASFNRFPRLVESRYDLAFRYLASHCRKRSLVVLISNVIDEVNTNQIERYLGNLVGRHLPLGVLLRDHQLFDAVEIDHPRDAQLWRAAAAAEILSWRHQVLTDLVSKGVLALDVFPENMTAPLINRYLEIKARHLL
jgi:uncharacterized protein (DUF58 family)